VSPVVSPRPLILLLALVLLAAGCGGGNKGSSAPRQPVVGKRSDDSDAAKSLGFPGFATKNTTRVGGADPIADAAGVAQAVYPARSRDTRPAAVSLVDVKDWRAAISAAQLMSRPLRAPVLLSDGEDMPDATKSALAELDPTGAPKAGNAQVIRVGKTAKPEGVKTTDVEGGDPAALAQAIDKLHTAAAGEPSAAVVIAPSSAPEYAMPAAAWAAKAGDPVLFVHRDSVPQETKAALLAHDQPRIYILGPPAAVSASVASDLRKLGTVKRLGAPNPIDSAIAFARYTDPTFGWGVVDPGHGLVFARSDRPLDAAAASPLSVSGSYGPLLLLAGPTGLDGAVGQYLLDIQPGYTRDPVRGVYNHGWIVGDDRTISVPTQARIDSLLEIRKAQTTQPSSSSP
jgi:hypothetical protein